MAILKYLLKKKIPTKAPIKIDFLESLKTKTLSITKFLFINLYRIYY